MKVHSDNFGARTALRCGFLEGRYILPDHIHQFPEIVICLEGSMVLTVDGISKTMNEGDIAVIAPFRPHSFYTPKHVKRWLAVFSEDLIAGTITRDELYGIGDEFVFHASTELMRYILPKLLDSQENFLDVGPVEKRTFKAVCFSVYEEYMRKIPLSTASKPNQTLPSILLYINEHYREDITLAQIGAALGYSPKYISLCLSRIEKFNFFNLVNSFRSEYAKTLLLNTDLKMIDIAYECGYNNEKSFYRAFKQVVGITPGEYKKNKRTVPPTQNQ